MKELKVIKKGKSLVFITGTVEKIDDIDNYCEGMKKILIKHQYNLYHPRRSEGKYE